MSRRGTTIAIAATMVGAIGAALVVGRVLAPSVAVPAEPPPLPAPIDPGAPATAVVRWLVDVGERASALELVAHPPIAVGDRILVAGSRIGYVALDRARGAIAWRRRAGPSLAAPLVLDPHDVVLVRDCDVAVSAPAGAAVVACFERIDPLDIAGRAAGSITAPLARAADCTASGGAWQLDRAAGGELRLARGACALGFTLPAGVGRPVDAPAAPAAAADPDCETLADGTPWCQRVVDGASVVEVHGARIPGLSLLAAAVDGRRAVAVVRLDASLRRDAVVAIVDGQPSWTWPLPEPALDRSTPIGVALAGPDLLILFDSSRVAALVAPL